MELRRWFGRPVETCITVAVRKGLGDLWYFAAGLWNVLVHGSYSAPEYIVCDTRKVCFIPISKVGNSSLKAAMFPVKVEDNYEVHVATRMAMTRWLTPEQKTYYTFVFLRNPVTRMLSLYQNKLVEDPIKFGYPSRIRYYLFGHIWAVKNLQEFISRVCAIPDWWADEHFRSQWSILEQHITSGGGLNYVGRFEHFRNDFEVIKGIHGFEELPVLNQTISRIDPASLDEATSFKISQRYQRDFKLIGLFGEIGAKKAKSAIMESARFSSGR